MKFPKDIYALIEVPDQPIPTFLPVPMRALGIPNMREACAECRKPIPPGKSGRKCKECRDEAA